MTDAKGMPEAIADLCAAFVHGLQEALGDKLAGVYLYGAAAFPDSVPSRDVDFHAILKEKLTTEERAALNDLHAALTRDFPPLGAELDGYYILWQDAGGARPPADQLRPGVADESWALHCAHIRAGRCIPLYGPDPLGLYPAPAWPELEAALHGELRYVAEHPEYPDYGILNLCRLMYSFETRDVVISKAMAAEWARRAMLQWRLLIELAKKSYAGQATVEDKEQMTAGLGRLYEFACRRIRGK